MQGLTTLYTAIFVQQQLASGRVELLPDKGQRLLAVDVDVLLVMVGVVAVAAVGILRVAV